MESASKSQFAGCILFRATKAKNIEVLLVQPIGKGRKRWAIPSVEVGAEEEIAEAAKQVTQDEAGVHARNVDYLGFVEYPKYKLHCFFGQAAASASPSRKHLEVREAKFIPLEEALELVDKRQQKLLNALRSSIAFAA